jgi:hypothetical protein
VRLGKTIDSDRAIENIARKNLRADDEARAVKALSETSDNAFYAKPGVI